MKNAHTIDINDPVKVPAFWRKEWLKGAIKELNERTMSPENRALYNISLGRLMAINEHYEIERRELVKDTKTQSIQKALKGGKLTVEEIADYNDVSVDFVLNIKKEMEK